MGEFLVVKFPDPREVLVNGTAQGLTNAVLTLEAGAYIVSPAPPHDFAPPDVKLELSGTSPSGPAVVTFERIAQGAPVEDTPAPDTGGIRLEAGLRVLAEVGVCPHELWAGELTPQVREAARRNRIESYDRDALARLKAATEDVWSSVELTADLQKEIDATLEALGITRAAGAAKDFRAALGEARAVLDRGNRLLTPLLRAPDRGRAAPLPTSLYDDASRWLAVDSFGDVAACRGPLR